MISIAHSQSSNPNLDQADKYSQAIAGVSLAGLGIHKFLSGDLHRKRTIDRLRSDIEVKSFSDLLKSRNINDTTEQLRANTDKMANRLEMFFNSMKHNVNEIRKSIRFFVRNQDLKARRLRMKAGLPADDSPKAKNEESSKLRQRKLLRDRKHFPTMLISLDSEDRFRKQRKLKFSKMKLHGKKSRSNFVL